MSPSSPVSVGTFPSNRTLLVGIIQVCLVVERTKFEHFLDPFTATKFDSKGNKYSTGTTIKTILVIRLH